MLIAIDNVLDPKTLGQVQHALQLAPWQDGKHSAGSLASQVKANQQLDDSAEVAGLLRQHVLKALSRHPLFVSAALPQRIYPPKFNSYSNGGHYGTHVDAAVMVLPDGSNLRTDLSATLFLSDPDTYDGGELVIETQYGAQEVKLNAGDLILYPSTSLHQVAPVTRGARLASFFWVQSMVRDTQQRTMLFDLDQSIQALTLERGAADEQVARLTGIYHNLVRLWGEV